jgi:hypothetical protein
MPESATFDQFDAEESRTFVAARILADPDLPNWPGVIELTFDEFTTFVCIETEFDTLLCTRTLPESYRHSYTIEIPAGFWNSLIGWTLTEAWRMTNDRGYPDAIHLRFREQPNSGLYRHVQLWGICSSIRLWEFKVVREEPPAEMPSGS